MKLLLLSILFITGCGGYTKPIKKEFIKMATIEKDFDTTWTSIIKIFADKNLKIEFIGRPTDDPQIRRPDLTKAQAHLAPWKSSIPLEVGLVHLLDWLKNDLVDLDFKNLPI